MILVKSQIWEEQWFVGSGEREKQSNLLKEVAAAYRKKSDANARQRQQECLIACLSHDHHGDAAVARFIQFDEKQALPSAKLQLAVGDVEHNGGW